MMAIKCSVAPTRKTAGICRAAATEVRGLPISMYNFHAWYPSICQCCPCRESTAVVVDRSSCWLDTVRCSERCKSPKGFIPIPVRRTVNSLLKSWDMFILSYCVLFAFSNDATGQFTCQKLNPSAAIVCYVSTVGNVVLELSGQWIPECRSNTPVLAQLWQKIRMPKYFADVEFPLMVVFLDFVWVCKQGEAAATYHTPRFIARRTYGILQWGSDQPDQWFCFSWNIVSVSLKNVYFIYLEKSLLDQSIEIKIGNRSTGWRELYTCLRVVVLQQGDVKQVVAFNVLWESSNARSFGDCYVDRRDTPVMIVTMNLFTPYLFTTVPHPHGHWQPVKFFSKLH